MRIEKYLALFVLENVECIEVVDMFVVVVVVGELDVDVVVETQVILIDLVVSMSIENFEKFVAES